MLFYANSIGLYWSCTEKRLCNFVQLANSFYSFLSFLWSNIAKNILRSAFDELE